MPRRVRMWWSNMAPKAAMPTAMPSWRNVLLTPEARPLRSTDSTPTMAAASAGLITPIARPATRKPGSRCVQSSETSRPRMSSRLAAISSSPAVSGMRSGTRLVALPESGATTNSTSVIGSSRRPVPVGERPRSSWK